MKNKPIPKPSRELKAKCDADDQFGRFDRALRSVMSVSKADFLKEEAKWKRGKKHAKKRTA